MPKKKISLIVDEKWLEAINNLTRDVYENEVCVWLSIEDATFRDYELVSAIEAIVATDGDEMNDGECLDKVIELISKYKAFNFAKEVEELQPRDLVADHEQTRSADAEMGDL